MIQAPTPTFFTFWDMDDTSVNTDDTIKNAHLLLPIKLFQTRATNQHFGILTNRAPSDKNKYSVNQYLCDLNDFGIVIPRDHVIFGGGENAQQSNKDLDDLELALRTIQAQIQSLKLTDVGDELAKIFPQDESNPLGKLMSAKYHGKNYHITDFLNRHFYEQALEYRFQTGVCAKDALTFVMIDDLESISEKTQLLGKQFIGIKASRGGNTPKYFEDPEDFYQDDYLFCLAETIGLADYAKSLLRDRISHANDDALLQISGLLYAWHAFPKEIDLHSLSQFKQVLTSTECEQVAKMLGYIKKHANTHPHAHYRRVDELANLFQNWADDHFLNDALDKYQIIKFKMEVATKPVVALGPEIETPQLEQKKKGFGSLMKTFGSKSNMQRKELGGSSKIEQDGQLEQLAEQESVLKERLMTLMLSTDLSVAYKARKVMEMLEKGNANCFSSAYTELSSSSELLLKDSKSYTPLATNVEKNDSDSKSKQPEVTTKPIRSNKTNNSKRYSLK